MPMTDRGKDEDKNLSAWLDIETALREMGVLVIKDDDAETNMRAAAVEVLDRRYGHTWPRAPT